jgi:hypothetical protein
MRLAKERIDIGLYTTNGPQLREFWHNQIGLPFDLYCLSAKDRSSIDITCLGRF